MSITISTTVAIDAPKELVYSGALDALVKPFLSKERNRAGYEDFNRVLKQRVESVRDAG